MSELNKCPFPPKGPKQLWVERLKANQILEVVCLSPAVEGYMTHWQPLPGKFKGYSIPCTNPTSECEGHKRGLGQRWRGIMHCFQWNKGKQLYLEITPETQEHLGNIMGPDLSYRGHCFRFTRMDGDQTRVKVELLPDYAQRTKRELAPFKSADATMQKMWDLNQEKDKSRLQTVA